MTSRTIQTAQETLSIGDTDTLNSATLPKGWIAVDTQANQIRVFDGVNPGGIKIPNESDVDQMINSALNP